MKECVKCNKTRPLNDFWNDKTKPSGKASTCKHCRSKQRKERWANGLPDDVLERKRQRDRDRSKRYDVRKRNLEHHKKYRKTSKYKKAAKKYLLKLGLKTNIVFVECEDCDAIECIRKSYQNNRKYKNKCAKCNNMQVRKDNYNGWDEKRRALHREQYKQKRIEQGVDICNCCGKRYYRFEDGANHSTCSDECREKRRKHLRKARKRLRNKRSENHKENYNHINVFNRDKWKCQNCGCKVQKKDIYADNAAEVDHIITLADGGKDEYWNVQTLCRKCNSSKGANSEGQLQIFHYCA